MTDNNLLLLLLLSRFSRVRLCDLIDGSPLGSPVPGILQARTLEWVAISFSRGSSPPSDHTPSPTTILSFLSCSSWLWCFFLAHATPWPHAISMLSIRLYYPARHSLPGTASHPG